MNTCALMSAANDGARLPLAGAGPATIGGVRPRASRQAPLAQHCGPAGDDNLSRPVFGRIRNSGAPQPASSISPSNVFDRSIRARANQEAGLPALAETAETASGVVRPVQPVEALGEVGLEILDVLQPNMDAQQVLALGPRHGGAVLVGMGGDQQALVAAPARTHAEDVHAV